MKKTLKATKNTKAIKAAAKTPLFSDKEIAQAKVAAPAVEMDAEAFLRSQFSPEVVEALKAVIAQAAKAPEGYLLKTIEEKINQPKQAPKTKKAPAAKAAAPVVEKKKAWNTPEERNAFLKTARETYFAKKRAEKAAAEAPKPKKEKGKKVEAASIADLERDLAAVRELSDRLQANLSAKKA